MEQPEMESAIRVPVLIVGGGGAGLTASMLLSQLGVETLLVSSLPTTSILPKAHVLNQRAMEILTDAGVADEIYRRGTPARNMRRTAYYAGFAGSGEHAGRRIAALDAWGAGGCDPDWALASPCRSTNLPQIRLEPILKRRAEELAPGRVRFHHEVVALREQDDGVVATVADRDNDRRYEVHATYVMACDGGRTIGRMLGVEMQGPRGLSNQVSLHISADLSAWARDPDVLIRWIFHPETAAMTVLVPMGPERWGPDSEEWVFHMTYGMDDPRTADDAEMEADMRRVLGIGDHPVTIHKISRWSMEGIVASKFRVGRVFLVGDAAHRHPPTGGLGLNSAIHDAHNLCWKLAAVLAGTAGDALLDTYEAERRPVDARNVERSLENAFHHRVIGGKLGLVETAGVEANRRALARLWDERPEHDAFRAAVHTEIAAQSMEFREHGVEYGYDYASSAVVPDGSVAANNPDPVRIYRAEARPGRPMPHAWIEDADGRRSILELVRPGRFLLVAGDDGVAWRDAAERLSTELPLDFVSVGHPGGDVVDVQMRWLQTRGTDAGGAVLVRPDRCVAWRAPSAAADPDAELRAAFGRILGTHVRDGQRRADRATTRVEGDALQ